jgi:hypothetical protein
MATLYVMVDIVKGSGCVPPSSPGWTDFSIMMEYRLDSGHCLYSLIITLQKIREKWRGVVWESHGIFNLLKLTIYITEYRIQNTEYRNSCT